MTGLGTQFLKYEIGFSLIIYNNFACGRTENKSTFEKYTILTLWVFLSGKGTQR